MTECYFCNEPLTGQNRSVEHILPNSIGGRLKTNQLICDVCNNITGHLFDAEFAKLANPLASEYNIKRERGTVPNYIAIEKSTGKELVVSPGWKTSYLHPQATEQDGVHQITAANKERLTQELARIRKQMAMKGIVMEEVTFETLPGGEKTIFEAETLLEPDLFLKAICKIFINFYLFKTGDKTSLEQIITFLKVEMDNRHCWFQDLNIATQLQAGNPYHILIIKGDKKQKALYGYFEVFGRKGFVFLLTGKYTGNDLQLNYTYDAINHREIAADYPFVLNVSGLIQLIHSRKGLDTFYQI